MKKVLVYLTCTSLCCASLGFFACGDGPSAPDGKKYCITKITIDNSKNPPESSQEYGWVTPNADGTCPFPATVFK